MKKNKGITIISLIITIIVLLIITGTVINEGKKAINKAQLEEIRTNMLLIQAKAKEYVEKANFKIGIKPTDEAKMSEYEEKINNVREEIYEGEAKLQKTTETSLPSEINVTDTLYTVTNATLQEWGLNKIQTKTGETYLIEFDDTNATVEIYNTKGYNGQYSLTQIDNME